MSVWCVCARVCVCAYVCHVCERMIDGLAEGRGGGLGRKASKERKGSSSEG